MNLPSVCLIACRSAHTLLLALNGLNVSKWDPKCQMIRSCSENNEYSLAKTYWAEWAIEIVYWLQKLDPKILLKDIFQYLMKCSHLKDNVTVWSTSGHTVFASFHRSIIHVMSINPIKFLIKYIEACDYDQFSVKKTSTKIYIIPLILRMWSFDCASQHLNSSFWGTYWRVVMSWDCMMTVLKITKAAEDMQTWSGKQQQQLWWPRWWVSEFFYDPIRTVDLNPRA